MNNSQSADSKKVKEATKKTFAEALMDMVIKSTSAIELIFNSEPDMSAENAEFSSEVANHFREPLELKGKAKDDLRTAKTSEELAMLIYPQFAVLPNFVPLIGEDNKPTGEFDEKSDADNLLTAIKSISGAFRFAVRKGGNKIPLPLSMQTAIEKTRDVFASLSKDFESAKDTATTKTKQIGSIEALGEDNKNYLFSYEIVQKRVEVETPTATPPAETAE